MSREIKFRAYLYNKRYTVVSLELLAGVAVIFNEKVGETCNIDLDEVNLVQYTGLKDKNGKEIYEGDIVTFEGSLTDYAGIVEFKYGSYEPFPYWRSGNDYEVIGNIYENPELLEDP